MATMPTWCACHRICARILVAVNDEQAPFTVLGEEGRDSREAGREGGGADCGGVEKVVE